MTDADQQILWRQGDVLGSELIETLGLKHPEFPDDTVAIVVSHDCDLVNVEKETEVELIIGRTIASLGDASHAKVARRLHIEFSTQGGKIAVELAAPLKRSVSKTRLSGKSPNLDFRLDVRNRETLQRWLAARYRRTAFPDEFNKRLKKLRDRVKKVLGPVGQHVRAVLIDLDDGATVEREGPDDLYELHVTLLYDSAHDEPGAYSATEKAAKKIEDIFEENFFSIDNGRWQYIRLAGCVATSDNAMSIADSEKLRRWDLDDMSLRRDPQETMLG